MAITVDVADLGGKFTNDASVASIAWTPTGDAAAGSLVCVSFGWADKTVNITGVTDNGPGLTWNVVQRPWQGAGGNNSAGALAWALAPAGLTTGTVTAALSAAAVARAAGGTSFAGVATSSPLDGSTATGENVGTSASSGAFTLTAGSVLVSAIWYENSATGISPTSGSEAWEIVDNDGYGVALLYQVNASGGSTTNTGTISSSNWIHCSAAFLEAAAGGPAGQGPPYEFNWT
jgi:hypothetical protein